MTVNGRSDWSDCSWWERANLGKKNKEGTGKRIDRKGKVQHLNAAELKCSNINSSHKSLL